MVVSGLLEQVGIRAQANVPVDDCHGIAKALSDVSCGVLYGPVQQATEAKGIATSGACFKTILDSDSIAAGSTTSTVSLTCGDERQLYRNACDTPRRK